VRRSRSRRDCRTSRRGGRERARRHNRKIAAAASLVGQARYRAFGNLDIDLARNAAPLASYITDNTRHLVSRSTGCYFYQPVYELDLAAVCKK
jgi:hypothetical protein